MMFLKRKMIKKVKVWLLLLRVYEICKEYLVFICELYHAGIDWFRITDWIYPAVILYKSCRLINIYLSMLEPRRRAVSKIGARFHVLLPCEYYYEDFFSDGTLHLDVHSLKLEIHKSKLVFLRRHALTRDIYLTIALM